MPGCSLRSVRLFSALVFSSLLLGAAEATQAETRESQPTPPLASHSNPRPHTSNPQPTRSQADTAATRPEIAAYAVADAAALANFWGIPASSAAQTSQELSFSPKSQTQPQPALNPAATLTAQSTQAVTDEEAIQAYTDNADYGFDDAQTLANFWGISTWDAKIAIGRKLILFGEEGREILDDSLVQARAADDRNPTDDDAIQAYINNADYGFDDAQTLANFWGISTWDAKIAIGRKLILFGEEGREILDDSLADARAADKQNPSEEDAFQAYFSSAYGFRDAEVLANFWDISVADAKIAIGRKLLSGPDGSDRVDDVLATAWAADSQATSELLQFIEAGYTFEDAEALAAFWGLSIQEAKMLAGRKLLDDRQDLLEDALRSARSRF